MNVRCIIICAALLAVIAACADPNAPRASVRLQKDTGPATTAATPGPTVNGRVFDAEGTLTGPIAVPKVILGEDEWKERLGDDETFDILRRADTEYPGTGALLKNKQAGVYLCRGCDFPLFSSETKFESGTGWPSFFRAIAPENVGEHKDGSLGMVRTEIVCNRCDGHLGHVFEDGPQPTGLRYCVNSASLRFAPTSALPTLADPATMNKNTSSSSASSDPSEVRRAVFAGGCFWCVEAVFEELDGVIEAVSGYAGGRKETANYGAVSIGATKHAEVVSIVYDPSRIAYEDLLRVHFATHDPTTLNRQGNDRGPQYRSAIFYANAEEEALARAFIADLNDQKIYGDPIVTTLEPLTEFFPAENYHQNYVCNNPNQGYVRAIALPKVDKVRKAFKDRLKETSPLKK